jgi:hypothetical protein
MSHRWTRLAPRRSRTALVATLATAALGCLVIAASAQAASTLPTLALTVTPTSVTVGAAPQSGAVNVVVTATGKVKEGTAILFLLKPGVSVAEVETYIAEKKHPHDPNYTSKYGSIVFDTEASTGTTNEAQTYLQPGQYVALSAPGEGPPTAHSAFTVAASKAPVALPAPEATIRSIDFGFRGPSTIHDGELVRFENEGFLVHMDAAARAKNMRAARKLVKALRAGNEKAFAKLVTGFASFAGPLSSGGFQQETITGKPGVYVQVCFMETQDGRDHALLGMERIIRITK